MATFVEKSEQNQYEKRIQRHKRQKLFVIVGIVGVLAVVCVYMVNSYINRKFNSYNVSKTIERQDTGSTAYYPYKNQVLKVSRDGASAVDAEGNITFNGSYEMQKPAVDICEDYIAVADIGGKDIYVFDGENSGTKITVTSPIIQVQVARQGVIAVLTEGKDTNTIQLLKTNTTTDAVIVDRPTNVYSNGFPVSIALSDDGTKLVTSYLLVNNGVIQNQITFYNFGEVGQNEVNKMVGMKDFGKTIVSKVTFLGNDTVCVFKEDGFELFSMKEKSKEIENITFKQEIKSVFHSSSYVGVVLDNGTQENPYQVVVYDTSGNKVLDCSIDYNYEQIYCTEKEILFFSEYEGHVLKLNGVEKFRYNFPSPVISLLPINDYNKYFLISDNNIDIIKLTEE